MSCEFCSWNLIRSLHPMKSKPGLSNNQFSIIMAINTDVIDRYVANEVLEF